MSEPKVDRKNLERRRDEILTELDRVNSAERIELDRDQEQAIQLEQDQVPVSMEENLRRELDQIETQLADGG